MARPPAARAKALRAFAQLVIDQGERSATLEAVAAAAGISKGGLLYHFGSKDALVDGLLGDLRLLIDEDVETVRTHPAGASEHILRTSVPTSTTDFELYYLAATRLAQGSYPRAATVMQDANAAWTQAVADEIGDAAVARLVVLISDGLYANTAVGVKISTAQLDEVVSLIGELAAARSQGRPTTSASGQRSPRTQDA